MLPDVIEKLYHKLIRSALNVRHNTPSELILNESGLLPLKALVAKRQLKYFRKFKVSIRNNSIRQSVFNELFQVENRTTYLNHYVSLDEKYMNPNDISVEAMDKLKTFIRNTSSSDKNYRYYIYSKISPDLLPSPFLSCVNNADAITRFRLGSHNLPIEPGRCSRTLLMERLCPKCNLLGDEYHFLFYCSEIVRDPSYNFTDTLHEVSANENVFSLFNELANSEFLKFV